MYVQIFVKNLGKIDKIYIKCYKFNMISISDALDEIIQSYPFIEEGLSKGIINYSAFARIIRPQIEKRLYKEIKTGAIVMALKRISQNLSQSRPKIDNINLTDLTVRSNLSEYTFLNSDTLAKKTSLLFNKISHKKDILCALSEGVRETTFIISAEIISEIKKLFKDEAEVSLIANLSSITIRLPKEAVYTPGVYYQILKRLAFENINFIEVLSTYTELTIIFETKDVDKAFSVLRKLNNSSL